MPRLALVRDGSSDSLYYYCAAAPAFVFRDGGIYQAPVLADAVGNVTVGRFFDAYKKCLAGRGGLRQLVAVGGVAADDVAYARDYFGLAEENVWKIPGPPPRVACELSRDWVSSEYIVVAPYVAAPTVHDMESAANAASLAAFLNAPLFYAEPSGGLAAETLGFIGYLRPSKAVIVEIGDCLPPSVNASLAGRGVRVVADLTSERDAVTHINGLTDPAPPVLCGFRGEEWAGPAAVAAARYGGFVLEVPASVGALSRTVWAAVEAEVPQSRAKLLEPYAMPASVLAGEQALADEFYAWLEGLGGADQARLEYVLTFAPAFGEGSLSYAFERAITGDTETPDERGAAAGRFVNPPAESLAAFNLTSAYRALIFAHPRPDHVTFCGVAYMAHNAVSCPETFKDNYGRLHKVNEVLGCRGGGFDDPGVFSAFRANAYDAAVHDGRVATSGRHPLVPSEDLRGFPMEVYLGTSFFYCSSHGGPNSIYPFVEDDGVAANVPWGRADWPGGPSGIVNFEGDGYSYKRWEEMGNKSPGLVAAFNACSLGAGEMNAAVTRQLGAASISPYTPVWMQASGWFWISFVDRLVEHDYTLGEAICFATAQVSEIFPAHRGGVDSSIRYVLAGDPFMPYYKPTWQPPAFADPGGDYGGHNPGGSGPLARDFAARAGEEAVTLSWRAVTNRAVAGCNIYRAKGPNAAAAPGGGASGPVKVNGRLISGKSPFVYVDDGLTNGKDYYYWLEAVEGSGRTGSQGPVAAVPEAEHGEATFALTQNFPNPFREATTVAFVVPGGPATLTVYDLRGAAVRRLWEGAAAGFRQVAWDGAGDDGAPLPPGVYLYKLEAGERTAVKKLVLVR